MGEEEGEEKEEKICCDQWLSCIILRENQLI